MNLVPQTYLGSYEYLHAFVDSHLMMVWLIWLIAAKRSILSGSQRRRASCTNDVGNTHFFFYLLLGR